MKTKKMHKHIKKPMSITTKAKTNKKTMSIASKKLKQSKKP